MSLVAAEGYHIACDVCGDLMEGREGGVLHVYNDEQADEALFECAWARVGDKMYCSYCKLISTGIGV